MKKENQQIEKSDLQLIIDIVRENDELKRGIGDAMLILCQRKNKHESMKNDNVEMSFILQDIYRLVEENEKLKKQIEDKNE